MRWTIGILIGGLVLVVMGVREWQLAGAAKNTPKTISCEELIKSGPGDNAHVIVTDALPVTVTFVHRGGDDNSGWLTVWIPVIPATSESVERLKAALSPGSKPLDRMFGQIELVVKSSNIHDRADLDRFKKTRTLQGLIISDVEQLSDKERDLLKSAYPMGLGYPLLLEDGRRPSGIISRLFTIGAGIALLFVGGRRGFRQWRRPEPATTLKLQ